MSDTKTTPTDAESLVAMVRDRYGNIARSAGGCCSPSCCDAGTFPDAGALGYDRIDLALLPEGADLGLGCGAPLAELALEPGETVLDLGSGAGIDVLIAASKVGENGRVIGVDMTPSMIEKARANAAAAGLGNVEIREGRLESLPVDDASVDAVTSNCVINLVPDKAVVFREIARVLRPGGRLAVSDIVLDGPLPEAIADDVLAYAGCVAGAMLRDAYFEALADAGLTKIVIVKDVDFLAVVGNRLPEELAGVVERTAADPTELDGIVRSVTYVAHTPAQG